MSTTVTTTRVTFEYLMRKSKADLAHEALAYLDLGAKKDARISELEAKMRVGINPANDAVVDGAHLINMERKRQIESEGWTAEHDKQWRTGELICASIVYLVLSLPDECPPKKALLAVERLWPWDQTWIKPKTHLRNLEKAGALIAAEIDRYVTELAEEVPDLGRDPRLVGG